MIGTKLEKPLQENELTELKQKSAGFDKKGNEIFSYYEERTPNPAPNTYAKYAEAATWCNANNALIEDKGDYYEVVAVPAPTTEELAAQARSQRDALIAATDYLMASDYPIDDETRAAVSAYRQALRDVPQQEGFPYAIVWPEKPVIAASN